MLTKRQEYCLLISAGGWGQRRGECDITHTPEKVSNLWLKQADRVFAAGFLVLSLSTLILALDAPSLFAGRNL